MFCSNCGEENGAQAKFCSNCGSPLGRGEPEVKRVTAASPEVPEDAGDDTFVVPPAEDLRPLTRNPVLPNYTSAEPGQQGYAKRHMPVKGGGANRAAKDDYSAFRRPEPEEERQPVRKMPVKQAPGRSGDDMFLFDDEVSSGKSPRASRSAAPRSRPVPAYRDDPEPEPRPEKKRKGGRKYEDEADEYYDDDEYYEDDSSIKGKLIAVLSVVVVLAVAVIFIMFSSTGRQLRARFGLSSSGDDYLLLARSYESSGDYEAARGAYNSAFRLRQGDYMFALDVGSGFERIGAYDRAEQLYLYLIDMEPLRDEPYDRLIAMFTSQGKQEEYEALLRLRGQNQGVTPAGLDDGGAQPASALEAPIPSVAPGTYTGGIDIALSASADAVIYYTRDGSEPGEGSIRYIAPIRLESGQIQIRAVAIRNGEKSPEWSGTFTVSAG